MKDLNKFTDQIKLGVASSHGKYMFETLRERWGKPENIEQLKADWFATFTKNEQIEWYHEAQTNILDKAIYTIDGQKYHLYMNEDLWFIPVDCEIPEEWMI